MNESRWCTKEDIQKDLARATGQRIPDVDEGYFVYGERPPPPRIHDDEDSELELHFGHDLIEATTATLDRPPPDLHGITKMLHMVQTYERENWMEDTDTLTSTDDVIVISKPNNQTNNTKQKLDPQSTISQCIVASKLNPNVQEFVPRTKVICYSQISKCSLGDCNIEINSDNNTFEPREAKETINQHQIEQAVKHNETYNMPQSDECCEFKMQAYTAIANILELHSSSTTGPIKLHTPDFYSKTPDVYCKADAAHDPTEILTANKNTLTEPDAKEQALASLLLGEVRVATDVAGPTVSPNAEKRDDTIQAVDENEVKASIHKVTNWLDGKPGGPSPTPKVGCGPHLGPVSYKRKQRPEPANQLPSQPPPGLPSPGAYVPSPLASELSLQYLERSRLSPIEPPTMWQQLEADLKRRDAEIARGGGRNAIASRRRCKR